MSVLPIYLFGSEVLRKQAKPVSGLDNSVIKLIYDMSETMNKANGIGLAATQVGDLRRIIVIDMLAVEEAEIDEESEETTKKPNAERKTLVLINPEILEHQGSCTIEEGCLSIPEVRGEVARPEALRIKFRDANFTEIDLNADGMLARVIQHEVDHLNGVLFIDHLTKTKRTLLKPALRKIKKGEVDTSYPVISSPVHQRSNEVEV